MDGYQCLPLVDIEFLFLLRFQASRLSLLLSRRSFFIRVIPVPNASTGVMLVLGVA